MSANSPRATSWEWIQTALVAANLIWTTLCLGGYLPATLVVTGMLTAALLAVHFTERSGLDEKFLRAGNRAETATHYSFHPAGWWMLPFLIYAAANVLWITPVPWLGWQDWFLWAQMIAVFWVVVNSVRSAGPRQMLFITLIALGVAGVVLACYQRFVQPDWLMLGRPKAPQYFGRAAGSFAIPNSFAGFLLLVIPACGALAFRRDASSAQRVLFGWLAVVLLTGLFLTISRGAWIALVIALTIWPLLSQRWSLRRRVIASVATLLLIGALGAIIYRYAPKARERFVLMVRQSGELSRPVMWRAAWQIFRAHPAWGSGAGSYNPLFEKYRPEREQTEPRWAHNDYLNTLSDYGAVGFGLFFGAAGVIAWRGGRAARSSKRKRSIDVRGEPGVRVRSTAPPFIEDRRFHTALSVGLLAFGLQLFVEFHFKIPALGLAAATIAGLIVGRNWSPRPSAENPTSTLLRFRRAACAMTAGIIAVASLAWNLPRLRAEAIREELRREMDLLSPHRATSAEKQAVAERARDGLARAVALDPANAQAWADRSYALAILGHLHPEREIELGREAEVDARRALAASKTVPEFWVRLGVALDMQRRWRDAGPAFSEALERAPVSATMWFYQAYHFALNPVTRPLAQSAVATCLRLDPSIREADALRRHLMPGR